MFVKKGLKNPYLWILIIFLVSFIVLGKAFMFIFYITGLSLHNTTYLSFSEYRQNEIELNQYLQFVLSSLRIIIIGFLVYKTSLFIRRKIDIRKKDFLYAIAGFIAQGIIAAIGVGILYVLGTNVDIKSVSPNQDKLVDFIKYNLLLGIIFTVIFAPIVEEFVFRKLIIGELFKDKKYIGLFVSTVVFGFMHMGSGFALVGLVHYLALGFVFSWLYIKTGRIETSIAAHLINNFIGSIPLLFT